LIFFITLERSKTRQDKFESILEIIESIVSSPFVKAEADSVEYFVLCLKRYAVADLEGRAGRARPPLKIRKAYVIQR
jgi:hypothetical protein